jgi:B12-binding domain/radical SAM domain protein
MGVAAPHWVSSGKIIHSYSLNSTDPFSLYNAFRCAASLAEQKIGFWGKSNWKDLEARKNAILLMNYFEDDKLIFKQKFDFIRPNLLFIGAMTLSVPGAIQIAEIAKKSYGSGIFIVIGGKHVTESTYQRDGSIYQHESSLLRLMAEGKIPRVFDLVVAGDGEEITVKIGEVIGKILSRSKSLESFYEPEHISIMREAKGNWIAGWVDSQNNTNAIESKDFEINYDDLPLPAPLFGISSNFPVFNTDFTAHAYSDMSKGCSFDCYFCSERRSINGSLKQSQTAARRLARQFKSILDTVRRDYETCSVSAFVEDSILLGGLPSNLLELNKILVEEDIKIIFGGQFTVDLMLNKDRQNAIHALSENGFKYIFWGLETGNEEIASFLSKNIRQGSWIAKNEEALKFLLGNNIYGGVSVLFGQGETQKDRLGLLDLIKKWKQTFGNPKVISLNWAVQHPIQGFDDKAKYRYIDWGTPIDSPYLKMFTELFGEASTKYPIPGVNLPPIEDFYEIREAYNAIQKIS